MTRNITARRRLATTGLAALAALLAWQITNSPARADTLYVSRDFPGDAVLEIDSATGHVTTFASTGLSQPQGLAFDSAGNLYVANAGNNTIEEFTPGGVGSVFASGAALSTPVGLAFDSAGNLYVANAGNNTIEKFTPGGVGSVFASNGTSGAALSAPQGLAFDSLGNLYVANPGGPHAFIEKLDSGGNGSVFAIAGTNSVVLSAPIGLAFGSGGNLYVNDFNNSKIYKFDSGGVESVFADAAQPVGLAFNSAGTTLYETTQLLNVIAKYDASGNASVVASGTGQTKFIALGQEAAVPEIDPGSAASALALLGCGVVM
jgi:sugar lactone lactonase YvrE